MWPKLESISTHLAVLGVVTVVCALTLATPTRAASPLKGKVSKGTYTSSRGLFSVPVPKASNWAGVQFKVQDVTDSSQTNYDLVAFYVKDFGEVFVASVRRIPKVALDNMARDDPRNVLKNVSNKALGDWRQNFPEEPQVVEERFLSTPYGPGILRVYRAAKGSLLEMATGGSGRGFERFDVLIAVILVIRNDHYISAIAENDAEALEKEPLTRSLEAFFSEIKVPDTPRFDKR